MKQSSLSLLLLPFLLTGCTSETMRSFNSLPKARSVQETVPISIDFEGSELTTQSKENLKLAFLSLPPTKNATFKVYIPGLGSNASASSGYGKRYEEVKKSLIEMGVDDDLIHPVSLGHKSHTKDPKVFIEFYVAAIKGCPDLSQSPGDASGNFKNHACTTAMNLATMISDPRDLSKKDVAFMASGQKFGAIAQKIESQNEDSNNNSQR